MPNLHIGWGTADITPDQPVSICGQFHVRVSEGILDPLSTTALALDTGDAHVIFVSADLVGIPKTLAETVRRQVTEALPELDGMDLILNGTHSHSAPEVRMPEDFDELGGGSVSLNSKVELEVMPAADYIAFAAERMAAAVIDAWESRAPGAIGFGLGQAVIGRNRRSCYADGEARMYGDTSSPDFLHIEGYEDHDLSVLATWDADDQLTGLVVNLACPSQVSENIYQISADYWCETRAELAQRFGADLYVLGQCSAAGDQSPRAQLHKAAEARMLELAGRTLRDEIAQRICDGVSAILPIIAKDRHTSLPLAHVGERVPLRRRRLSQADVDEALAEADTLQAECERVQADLDAHPERRDEPRWYINITRLHRRIGWYRSVAKRFEIEQKNERFPAELHVVRLGDLAIASNPFEYYLDFGTRIKARSPAVQTMLVQLAGQGTYVPSERSVAGGGYGSVPASTPIGPEGGTEVAEWTLAQLNELFA